MSESTISEIIQDAIGTLSRVTVDLIKGEEEEVLVRRYKGQFVVPGVDVSQHLNDLRAGGCLRQIGKKLFLKDECNPVKLLTAS